METSLKCLLEQQILKGIFCFEPQKRAYSPQQAAGLASQSKKWQISLRSNPARQDCPDFIHPSPRPRSLLCFWDVRQLGISLTDLTRHLEISIAGVAYAVERGEAIAPDNNYQLVD